ncbi:putative lipoprotein YajG [Haloferula luteola]|uniref:Putative lipoprotein YajG n=1 Tax=Haloferula luteola TaxID=595692 RepID=A0A840V7P8_9BACT|nr:hypothetical protein [Haloferula luteola]MBB5349980.1 putative lipoprotein YajG [Haloferula luteola]
MKLKSTLLFAASALLFAACQKNDPTASPGVTKTDSSPSPALSAILDASVTGDAVPIHILRETAQPGDTVTVRGRVMGNASPFVEGRAAFIIGDPEVLTACSDNEGDECETPWDNCCDTPEDKKRGTATVQIVGADGRVLKEGVEGVGGVGKLVTLTVSGTVAEGSSPELLVIDARAIDVVR